MIKVITYGTYDYLHYGHIALLKRAKELGDYLIVAVTSDDFDRMRGKLNVQQNLMERIEGVKATGLADEIIVEEYHGQKIDDIKRYGIDIFAIGSDWKGQFDYLEEFCKVVYLPRTKGISSSQLRSEKQVVNFGLVGESVVIKKFYEESKYVNGLEIKAVVSKEFREFFSDKIEYVLDCYEEMLEKVDAVYIASVPSLHYKQIMKALKLKKSVICEAPIALRVRELRELEACADENGCLIFVGIKTAYALAYSRLILLAKSGMIGDIVSVDATCTSLQIEREEDITELSWGSLCAWGPVALLPIFQLLGTQYNKKEIITLPSKNQDFFDFFTKIFFVYEHSVASIKVGKGVKSEGELVITGTKGYIYVPAPWWKTDYFEVRFENQTLNKRYFYQLEGEGIRYEQMSFVRALKQNVKNFLVEREVSEAITKVIDDFYCKNVIQI